MSQNWYYQVDGEQRGPVSPAELKRLVTARKLGPTDLVRREDADRWVPAAQVKGLFAAPAATPQLDGDQVPGSRQQKLAEEAEPLPLPDEDEDAPPRPTRGGKSQPPPVFWAKAIRTWRRSSTPTKVGILGGAGAVIVLFVLVPVILLSGGNSSSGGKGTSTGGTKTEGDVFISGSERLTRLEFVNTLLAKSGHRKVESLDPHINQFGGGTVDNLGAAATRDRQGRVFVHHALGGRFDHDWWVKTFGDFRVQDFFDPTDNEMLNTNDATMRTGKWTYKCSDGPLTFIGGVVESKASPTGTRQIMLRRFGLFE